MENKTYTKQLKYNEFEQSKSTTLSNNVWKAVYEKFNNSVFESIEDIKNLKEFEGYYKRSSSVVLRFDNINYLFRLVEIN